jgi:hypothetical protein
MNHDDYAQTIATRAIATNNPDTINALRQSAREADVLNHPVRTRSGGTQRLSKLLQEEQDFLRTRR